MIHIIRNHEKFDNQIKEIMDIRDVLFDTYFNECSFKEIYLKLAGQSRSIHNIIAINMLTCH